MFPCERCGCCCRLVGKVSFARYLALDDGSCKHLDKETNLCKIYSDRPYFCRVDELYEDEVSKYMTREKFYEVNKKACKKFQADERLNNGRKSLDNLQNRSQRVAAGT